MGLRRFLVILTAVVVTMLIMAVWFSPPNDDFRTENPFWNGTRDISTVSSASPLGSFSDLPSSPRGSTLIVVPYLNFTPAELEALDSFITRGGTLILADDYGYGNQVLDYLGLKARFSRQPLLDPLCNYKNKWFPRILQLKSGPLTGNIEGLVLNHATCLTGIKADEALALSSRFSFLDMNDNGVWDKNELAGPLPVISRHNLGSGQIILIADPSLFINSMEAIADNHKLIQNIAADTSAILIDQSHLPRSNLYKTKGLLAQVRGSLGTLLGTSGLIILALSLALRPIWHKAPNILERRR